MTSNWVWVVNTDALNGRAGPSTETAIKVVRHRGDRLPIVSEVTGDGRTWLVTADGTHYARELCRRRVASPCPGYRISTPYGKRKAGLWPTKGYHTGDDYAAPRGADVVAVLSGRVRIRRDGVLGLVALLYADNGRTYWYCHLARVTRTGRVKAGDKIGDVGDSGTGARGPHLHFEDHAGHTTSWWAKDRDPRW